MVASRVLNQHRGSENLIKRLESPTSNQEIKLVPSGVTTPCSGPSLAFTGLRLRCKGLVYNAGLVKTTPTMTIGTLTPYHRLDHGEYTSREKKTISAHYSKRPKCARDRR
ncbi:hypothetical protein ACLOJK_034232 [Asimina triloba]